MMYSRSQRKRLSSLNEDGIAGASEPFSVLVRNRRFFRRWHALGNLSHLDDLEIEQCFAFFSAGGTDPRKDQAMRSKLRNRKATESKHRFHPFLFDRNLHFAISDQGLLAVRR